MWAELELPLGCRYYRSPPKQGQAEATSYYSYSLSILKTSLKGNTDGDNKIL